MKVGAKHNQELCIPFPSHLADDILRRHQFTVAQFGPSLLPRLVHQFTMAKSIFDKPL